MAKTYFSTSRFSYSGLNFRSMTRKMIAFSLLFAVSAFTQNKPTRDTDKKQPETFTVQSVISAKPITKTLVALPTDTVQPTGETVFCGAASLPDSPQPVIQDGFWEYKFFIQITPAKNSGPIAAHEIDCGEYTVPADTVFNIAKTIIEFGTLQGGMLSTEMEVAWPDGRERTFYEVAQVIPQVTGPTTAVQNSPGLITNTWPRFTFHVPAGTKIHFTFNYAIPDPQHTCNPSCIAVANDWLMGDN